MKGEELGDGSQEGKREMRSEICRSNRAIDHLVNDRQTWVG